MSQSFQEILQDYGVWVAETTSSPPPTRAACVVLPERRALLPPVSFKPPRLNEICIQQPLHRDFEKGLASPLCTFTPIEPLNSSNSYSSPGFTRTSDSSFDVSEDDAASQAPSLTFSSSTLSPGRNVTSPSTPVATLQPPPQISGKTARSRDESPQKTHIDNKSKFPNISFPIQQPGISDSSAARYHTIQGAVDEASYKPKRPAPTPPSSSDFNIQITPPAETSFMDWDDSSGKLARVTGSSMHLRTTLRRNGTKKQNSSHRHVVRHHASTEGFNSKQTERGRPSRRVDHMHTTSDELKHHYPHKLSAKSAENLLSVPDGNRHEGNRLTKRPPPAARSPLRYDRSPNESIRAQQVVEPESGTTRFRGLVRTLITKLSQTSLRTRAQECQEDDDRHKLRSCSSTVTLRLHGDRG